MKSLQSHLVYVSNRMPEAIHLFLLWSLEEPGGAWRALQRGLFVGYTKRWVHKEVGKHLMENVKSIQIGKPSGSCERTRVCCR